MSIFLLIGMVQSYVLNKALGIIDHFMPLITAI